MAHGDLQAGAAFALLSNEALFLVAVTLAALFFFTRWSETGDRSAYAVGTLAGITLPAWLLAKVILAFVNDPLFAVNDVVAGMGLVFSAVSWLLRLLGLVALVVTLWAALRPVWLTGLFLSAPQGEVRKGFKRLEASWQLTIAGLIGARIVDFVVEDLLGRFW